MFAESLHCSSSTQYSDEKMLLGQLEGKLVVTKLLLKQGMPWSRIAELMDMTEAQIACVQRNFHWFQTPTDTAT